MHKNGIPDRPIRVLVVDDSPFIRGVIRNLMNQEYALTIVGEAENGRQALEKIPRLRPDVVLLDINMPVMDGITALKHIMIHHPVPTVMFSTLTKEGATETFDALKYGAVDFLLKPSSLNGEEIASQQQRIVAKIKMAAGIEIESIRFLRMASRDENPETPLRYGIEKICVMVASEGGDASLIHVISQLDPNIPAAYIVVFYQDTAHIDALMQYMGKYSRLRLSRACNGDILMAGSCYFLPGSAYAVIHRKGPAFVMQVTPSPFPDRRGAANMVMLSLSESFKASSSAVVLSGAGQDGAEGAREILRNGGQVFIQRPGTCLFKEMSNAAIEKCPEAKICSHQDLAANINKYLHAASTPPSGYGIRDRLRNHPKPDSGSPAPMHGTDMAD